MSLDVPTADAAGLRPASELGLDPGIWGRSSAQDLARALAAVPSGGASPPTLDRLLGELLTLEFAAPIDAAIDDAFFLARVDRLLAMGRLGDASALIERAGPVEARRFRRSFDIALLEGGETEACKVVEETPDLSPTYPARIFCLARLGQWDVAALTLGNAEALGILTEDEDQLLLHFLDPELFEGEPIPPAPRMPTPLQFRLFEAVGERIQTDQLPVAFAIADLSEKVGWQARLRAAERLTSSGAVAFDRLLEVFMEREPAASGGVFDRVEAIQALLVAVDVGSPKALGKTLPKAWAAARAGGTHVALAHWLAPRIKDGALGGEAGHIAFEIALLAGDADLAATFAGDNAEDRFLLALATGQGVRPPASNTLGQALMRGLAVLGPGPSFRQMIDDDRAGEALFRAIGQLTEGAEGNPQATQDSLALLRTLGLGDQARQIAVELQLMDGAA